MGSSYQWLLSKNICGMSPLALFLGSPPWQLSDKSLAEAWERGYISMVTISVVQVNVNIEHPLKRLLQSQDG